MSAPEITDRTVAAEARFVEEGHRAYLGRDETGPFVRVVSDTLGQRGIAYKVRAVASGPGLPLVFDCTPDGDVGTDGHRHLSRVDGRPTCKHAAGAARRMEREGLAELISAGVHGSAVIRDSRWVATEKACPPPAPPTDDDPFAGFPR